MRFESKIRRITKAQIHWTISDHVQFQPIIPSILPATTFAAFPPFFSLLTIY